MQATFHQRRHFGKKQNAAPASGPTGSEIAWWGRRPIRVRDNPMSRVTSLE